MPFDITQDEGRFLIKLARKAIVTHLHTGKKILLGMMDWFGLVAVDGFTGIHLGGFILDGQGFFIGSARHVALGPDPPPLG